VQATNSAMDSTRATIRYYYHGPSIAADGLGDQLQFDFIRPHRAVIIGCSIGQ